jgi:lipoprotein-releasing system permease protein
MILVATMHGGRFTGAYLERTQMIGILKAGANNWVCSLYNGCISLVDIVGEWNQIAILLLQKYFGIIKLNPKITMSIRRPYI